MFFSAIVLNFWVTFRHQSVSFHCCILKRIKRIKNTQVKVNLNVTPVNVELVKILTIFELTGGKLSKLPAKIWSTVLSSIVHFHLNSLSTKLNLDSNVLLRFVRRSMENLPQPPTNCRL